MGAFTLSEFKVSDFKDSNGNSYVNAAFKEFGEPVTMVVKDPSKLEVGQSLDGDIKPKQKTNGQGTYNRFYRTYNQEGGNSYQGGGSSPAPKKEWKERDDKAIQAQWSIGQAVTVALDMGNNNTDFIEGLAKEFFHMIDRVKTHTEEEAIRETLATTEPAVIPKADTPIDLSDIPF